MSDSSLRVQQRKRETRAMTSYLKREIIVIFTLLKDNFIICLIPHLTLYISISSAVSCPTPSGVWSIVLLALLYQLAFDTINQLVGIEEDAINKPHRPLPSGTIDVHGCIVLCIVVNAAYLTVGALHGVGLWCALWQLVSVGYLLRFDKNWFYKNHVFIPAGIVVQYMTAVCLANDGMYSQELVLWVFVMSVYFGLCATVQDIRDVAGDRATKRRTLPVILGLERTRYLFLAVMGIFSPIMLRWYIVAPVWDAHCGLLAMTYCPFHVLIIYRLAAMKNAGDHRLTYSLVIWMYIVTSASMYYIAPKLLLTDRNQPSIQSFNQPIDPSLNQSAGRSIHIVNDIYTAHAEWRWALLT